MRPVAGSIATDRALLAAQSVRTPRFWARASIVVLTAPPRGLAAGEQLLDAVDDEQVHCAR